jgi:multidrug efflux system membrane fusion protein
LLDQARTDLTRYETLAKQNSIARQTAEDQVFLIKQYEGLLKTDQAQIDTQDLKLTYARIVSPIEGRVGLRLVDAGNYVQTTDTGIAVLTQIHPISVVFTIPEDDIPDIMEKVERPAAPLVRPPLHFNSISTETSTGPRVMSKPRSTRRVSICHRTCAATRPITS